MPPRKKQSQWTDVRIPAGSVASEDIQIPADGIAVPPGQVTTSDGAKANIRGNDFTVDPVSDVACRIVLASPQTEDLVFKVKPEDADEADVS